MSTSRSAMRPGSNTRKDRGPGGAATAAQLAAVTAILTAAIITLRRVIRVGTRLCSIPYHTRSPRQRSVRVRRVALLVMTAVVAHVGCSAPVERAIRAPERLPQLPQVSGTIVLDGLSSPVSVIR